MSDQGSKSTPADALAEALATAMRARATDIAAEWLGILLARLPESPERIFPEKTLLNHIPLLLRRLAQGLVGEDPTQDRDVRDELRMITTLRRSQGYSLEELTEEFAILGGIVSRTLEDECANVPEADVTDGFRMARRLQTLVGRMMSLTTGFYREMVTSDLVERSQLLDSFGRAVSHELHNRLNAVSLSVELCRQRAKTAGVEREFLEGLDGIFERVQRADGVVAEVFAVAIAGGRVNPEGSVVRSIADVCTSVIDDMRPVADSYRVALRLASDLPVAQVDASRLQLVLVNLLTNAVKYSDPSKPERWVVLDAEVPDDGDHIVLRVRDNGIGIGTDERERIFDYRVRGKAVGERDGHGLGLSLARRAVKQLGGDLSLAKDDELEPGEVTRFCVRLERPTDRAPRTYLGPVDDLT